MRIKYCDLIATSAIHTEFNIAFLKVIMLALENHAGVDFYAEKEHCAICKERMKFHQIKFHPLKLLHKNIWGGIKTPIRDILSCWYVLKIFLCSKKEDFLFFALAYPFAQYVIWILSNVFQRRVYVCQHGELDVFMENIHFDRNRRYYSLVKHLLKKSNVQYIILGEPILKNVHHLFADTSKLIVIDHPYDFEDNDHIMVSNFNPLVIGQIGSGSKSKGTHYLFELATLLKEEIESGKLKIKLVGKLSNTLWHLDNKLVEYGTEILEPSIFEEEIKKLAFSLQLRDSSMGKAVASGTFFDTLKHEKPFLSLNSDYINYYVDAFPKCGKVCDSISDMAKEIKKLLQNKFIDEYPDMVNAIKHLQSKLSLASIASELKKQL